MLLLQMPVKFWEGLHYYKDWASDYLDHDEDVAEIHRQGQVGAYVSACSERNYWHSDNGPFHLESLGCLVLLILSYQKPLSQYLPCRKWVAMHGCAQETQKKQPFGSTTSWYCREECLYQCKA